MNDFDDIVAHKEAARLGLQAFLKDREQEIDEAYRRIAAEIIVTNWGNSHDLTPRGPPPPWHRVLRWRISGLGYRIRDAWRVLTGKASISDD